MSAEFEELMKARDNPSEEAQSKNKLFLFWSKFLHLCPHQHSPDVWVYKCCDVCVFV